MTHSTSIINLVDQSKLFGFRLGLALRLAFLHSLHLVLFLLLGLGDFRTRLDLLNNCGFLCSCWLDWGRYGFSWCWDQDDVDKFALRWPDTDDDELVKWIVLADRIDFIGELRIQISKSHDDPMLLLDCLMLKANDRFNQVLKPSCRRSFLQTAQFLHLQSFLRFLSFFVLFLGHWLLELHNSLDNSNIFLLKLMLKVVSKLEGSIGIGPAQFSLFWPEEDVGDLLILDELDLRSPCIELRERVVPNLRGRRLMAVYVDCRDDCDGEANNDEREFDETVDKFIQDSHRIFDNTIITNAVIKGSISNQIITKSEPQQMTKLKK